MKCFPVHWPTPTIPSHGTPKDAEAAARRTRIKTYFTRLKAADRKQSDPAATRRYLQLRAKRQEADDAMRAARRDGSGDAQRTWAAEHSRLTKALRRAYGHGPLGMDDDSLAARRAAQRKAAWLEGLHTFGGARLLAMAGGIGGREVSGAAGKAAVHQSLGYAPQAVLSGMARIVTEVPQIRINRGGRPRLASGLAPRGGFRQNNAAWRQARKRVEQACRELGEAAHGMESLGEGEAGWRGYERLDHALHKLTSALDQGIGPADNDRALWIALEREFRGKKASAVVSVIAGLASFGAYAVEPTGVAASAGQKLLCMLGALLQMPASTADYMDGSIDFPMRVCAERMPVSQLLKPAARHKQLSEIVEEDIDTRAAVRLYDEREQLMRDVLRGISLHALGRLNRERLRLRREAESHAASSSRRRRVLAPRARDPVRRLQQVEEEFREMVHQHVLFEQQEASALDPHGLIGRSICDPVHFCVQGVRAGIFGKLGEAVAQVNQRINNNWNPLGGIGPASVAMDAGYAFAGTQFLQDGLHSANGTGPDDPVAESAALGVAITAVAGAFNSGLTVIPARYNKTAHDRQALGPPRWLAEGLRVDVDDCQAQIEQAYRRGALSNRGKKKLEKILAVAATDGAPALRGRDLRRLEDFDAWRARINAMADDINAAWRLPQRDGAGRPVLDSAGREIVIDLRSTDACLAHYVPVWKRAAVLAKGAVHSMIETMRVGPTIAEAGLQRFRWRRVADGPRPAALMTRARRQLDLHRSMAPPMLPVLDQQSTDGALLDSALDAVARLEARERGLGALPALLQHDVWNTDILARDFRRQLRALRNALEWMDDGGLLAVTASHCAAAMLEQLQLRLASLESELRGVAWAAHRCTPRELQRLRETPQDSAQVAALRVQVRAFQALATPPPPASAACPPQPAGPPQFPAGRLS
ncbi:MAG TPA: hypothetical protein VIM12_02615 [Noviherbaspirillum sp.]|jgi:hypothetical protein|uniref:hypothetical protein n=1 Tax=Noviherbaspirillum sp. TaxID=1926288 RepID=UPI002F93451F